MLLGDIMVENIRVGTELLAHLKEGHDAEVALAGASVAVAMVGLGFCPEPAVTPPLGRLQISGSLAFRSSFHLIFRFPHLSLLASWLVYKMHAHVHMYVCVCAPLSVCVYFVLTSTHVFVHYSLYYI